MLYAILLSFSFISYLIFKTLNASSGPAFSGILCFFFQFSNTFSDFSVNFVKSFVIGK